MTVDRLALVLVYAWAHRCPQPKSPLRAYYQVQHNMDCRAAAEHRRGL